MTLYRAKHLPAQTGPAAWNEILGPQPQAQRLESDTTADFVVVGGGFAGLSAARRLTQLAPQARVVVLEAGRIAHGAAGRNSGFMVDLPHNLSSADYLGDGNDAQAISLNRHAIAFAAAAVEDYDIPPDFFDRCGKVNGAASQTAAAHNATYAKHLAALGEPSEALDAQAMHALTGSRYYSSGLYTPGTVVLQPAGYIRGLAAGLARSGVRVFEGSAVTDFARDGLGWAVRCAGGCVRADKVILTVNGHLESFGIETGRLMQLFLFATMTPDLDREALARLGGAPRWGITPSDPMGTTVRRIDTPLGGNRIITRTCATLRPGMRAHGTDLARAERVMRSKFEDRFPQLAGLKMEYSWAGHLCLSRNNVAVMREVEEGVFTGCVQNGLGTARGTLTGMGAAELACGVVSDVTRRFQVEPRPVRLPPQPFLGIGANAVLRWKEWTARTE